MRWVIWDSYAGSDMPRGLKITLAFIAGLIAGEAIPIVGYIVATNYLGLIDRDGGGAMGAIFVLGPMLALVCAVIVAIVTAWRTKPAAT